MSLIAMQPEATYLLQAYDSLPEAILWYAPVISEEEEIVDFEIRYCNTALYELFGIRREEIVGTTLLSTLLIDHIHREKIFDQCRRVYLTDQALSDLYYSEMYRRHLELTRCKVFNGVLCIITDKSRQFRAESKLRSQEEHYRDIIDSIQDGVLILRSIRDEDKRISDFRIEYCNPKGQELGRLPPDCVGKTIFELLPYLRAEELDAHKRVVETGIPESLETTFTTSEGVSYGWFIISLTKFGDGVVSRYTDISERKRHEQEIEAQKNLLDNVFDATLDGLFICRAIRNEYAQIVDLKIEKINKAFTRMIGLPETEVLSHTYLTLFPSAKENGVFDLDCHVINSGESVRTQVYYKGEHLNAWYELSVCRLDRESVLVSFSDISEVKNAFVEIQQQKTLLDNILRYSPTGIAVYKILPDPDGQIADIQCILANTAMEKLTGIPNRDRAQKTIYEILPEYRHHGLPEVTNRTLKTGEPGYTEFFHPVSQKWLEFSFVRMDEEQVLNVCKDITAGKEANLQTESLLQELKRSNTNLQEFAYVASHDLQEPLRKIHFFSESLRRCVPQGADAEFINKLGRMQSASARMARLIDDLLQYSRVGVKPDVFEWVNLNDTVEQVLQDVETTVNETRAIIRTEKLPSIKGDESQLRQMFLNIISNALKYRKPGIPPEISITVLAPGQQDGSLGELTKENRHKFHLIEIKDNGIGFRQEYAERIFQVFQRLHARAEYDGTGIGLAIVQKVVSNHNGFISAISEPGIGSAFRILLPKYPVISAGQLKDMAG